jgi:hypothetical protein
LKVNRVVIPFAPILRTPRSGALDDHPVRRRRKLRRRHGRLHRPWQTLNQTQFGIVSLCAVRDRSCRKIQKNIVIVVQDKDDRTSGPHRAFRASHREWRACTTGLPKSRVVNWVMFHSDSVDSQPRDARGGRRAWALIGCPAKPPDGTAMNEAARILTAIDQGDRRAAEQLLPLVYDELRRLAAQKLAHESPGHSLQATPRPCGTSWWTPPGAKPD